MKKYTYNEKFFSEIDSMEKAYWLGFLYADGCVRKNGTTWCVEITLAAVDEKHLEQLKNLVVPDGKIYHKTVLRGEKQFQHVRLVLTNNSIATQLISLGCVPRKTAVLQFPTWLTSELTPAFILGYFDGDGSIWSANNGYHSLTLSIEGNYRFLTQLQEIFISELGLTKNKIHQDRRSKNCSYKKQGMEADKLLAWLYHTHTHPLTRKYEKFIENRRLRSNSGKSKKKPGTLRKSGNQR